MDAISNLCAHTARLMDQVSVAEGHYPPMFNPPVPELLLNVNETVAVGLNLHETCDVSRQYLIRLSCIRSRGDLLLAVRIRIFTT